MKSWKLYISVFLVGYIVFALATVPASVALSVVKLPKGTQLAGVGGTVWEGYASQFQHKNQVVNSVSWNLSPFALLAGRVSADVQFGNARQRETISGKGHVSASFSGDGIIAENFTLRVPSALAIKQFSLPVKLETQGRFLLSLGTFEQATPYCQILNGKVTWQNAGVAYLGQSVNLGELAGTLGCDNGAITLAIKDVNPLGLQADIKVAEGNKVSAKGFVKPDGTMPRSVHQVVQMFGQPDREGRYIINL